MKKKYEKTLNQQALIMIPNRVLGVGVKRVNDGLSVEDDLNVDDLKVDDLRVVDNLSDDDVLDNKGLVVVVNTVVVDVDLVVVVVDEVVDGIIDSVVTVAPLDIIEIM